MKKPRAGVFLPLLLGFGLVSRFCLPQPASAVIANPEPFQLRQPDGSTFQARAWGDEWLNGTETLTGYTIALDEPTGRWMYAERNPEGRLVPSRFVVGVNLPVGIAPHVRPQGQGIALPGGPAAMPPGPEAAPPTAGTQRLLVIVTDFTPTQSLGTTETDWAQYFFSGGGTYTPTSVKNYWDTVSYGTITVQAASESYGTANNGIVFVTLNYAHPNPGGTTSDTNRQITRDALIAADSSVNFAGFDSNIDGYLSTNELHVYIISARVREQLRWSFGVHRPGESVGPPLVAGVWGGFGPDSRWSDCRTLPRRPHFRCLPGRLHAAG